MKRYLSANWTALEWGRPNDGRVRGGELSEEKDEATARRVLVGEAEAGKDMWRGHTRPLSRR
jgi:hypothetical protein